MRIMSEFNKIDCDKYYMQSKSMVIGLGVQGNTMICWGFMSEGSYSNTSGFPGVAAVIRTRLLKHLPVLSLVTFAMENYVRTWS